jgi:hypothetical protein
LHTQKLVNISNIIVNYDQVVQAYQKKKTFDKMNPSSLWSSFPCDLICFSKCMQIPFLINMFPKGFFVVPSSVSFLYILLSIYLYESDHKQWGNGAFRTCHYYT